MNKGTLVAVLVVLGIVLAVVMRVVFPAGGNEVKVPAPTEAERQMMLQMMPGGVNQPVPQIIPPQQ